MNFKLWESSALLKVANVGFIHQFHDDRWMFQLTFRWLEENDKDYYNRMPTVPNQDHIDLNNGRDFLTEKEIYDVVIVHNIYQCNNAPILSAGDFAKSKLDCEEAWRKRLASTQAKYIFTFGDWTEVSYYTLKDISGYEVVKKDYKFQVYRKS